MDLLRSLPLGLYLEQPVTWLHRLDPRVKLAWLMTFLLSLILADAGWRLFLVALLIGLTLSAQIPLRVWRRQIGWLLLLSLFVLALTALAPDGLAVSHTPRLPAQELDFAELPTQIQSQAPHQDWRDQVFRGGRSQQSIPVPLPQSPELPQPTGYEYVLLQQGPVEITRRSLELGIRTSTLLFTLIYGTNLFLLTTAPEEITAGLDTLMQPLRWFKWPVTEIILTLTLSLRFIPLVLEEVQNLVRSIRTRAINWKKLGVRGAAQIWLVLADRLLENLFLRAEQIAGAMKARGFIAPNHHQVEWHRFHLKTRDWIALGCLLLVWGTRIWIGGKA